jgi:hypothetical protein
MTNEPTDKTIDTEAALASLKKQKDEAVAEASEAPRGKIVTYDGETYEIPPQSEWDLEVLELFERGQTLTPTRTLVGEEQWAKFKSKPRKVKDLIDFTTAISGPGEQLGE